MLPEEKILDSRTLTAELIGHLNSPLEQCLGDPLSQLTQMLRALGSKIPELSGSEALDQPPALFFRTIIDADPNLIFVKDQRGHIVLANQAVAAFYGTTIDALLAPEGEVSLANFAKAPLDQGSSENWNSMEQLILENSAEKQVLLQKAINAQGQIAWFQTTKRQFLSLRKQETYFLFVATDVTVLKRFAEALHQSEARYRAIVEDQTDLVCRFQPDGTLTFVNASYCRYFSQEREQLLGQNFLSFLPEADRRRCLPALMALGPANPVVTLEHSIMLPNDRCRWQQWIDRAILDSAGQLIEFQAVGRDITEQKSTSEALQVAARVNSQLVSAINSLTTGVIIVDACSPGHPIIFVNPGFTTITGYTVSEALGEDGHFLQGAGTDRNIGDVIQEATKLRKPISCEVLFYRKDASPFWGEIVITPIYDQTEHIVNFACLLSDITLRKKTEEALRHSALHDALTDLPNRVLFLDRLHQAMAYSQRYTKLFAVFFLDIDRFKVINDSLGHLAGDQLLIAIARRLEQCLARCNTVARFGGDEFTILLEDVGNIQEVKKVAQYIHQTLAIPLYIEGHEFSISASIGIALSNSSYTRPEDLLRDADTALYRAKSLGGARSVVFDLEMYEYALTRLRVESDLRRAIKRHELHLVYQPIVELATGQLAGFEALVRWRHPQRGLISPTAFIPVAEETGLIVPIGQWVLREACHQMHSWQTKFAFDRRLTMSVNLSGREFLQPDLVTQIVQTLQETNCQTHWLKVEITESMMIDHADSIISKFHQLCQLGVQLCIDDFGVGYSSLRYLHRFPIQTVKIDRSFINTMNGNSESAAIVQTIITLAHTLGMNVVAEGLETMQHFKQIRALGCEYGQGFLFSVPLDALSAEELLAKKDPLEISRFEKSSF